MAHRNEITTGDSVEVSDGTDGPGRRHVRLYPVIDVDGTDLIVVGGTPGNWSHLELGESDTREAYRRLGEVIKTWDEQDMEGMATQAAPLVAEMALAPSQILTDEDLPLLVGYARQCGILDKAVELHPIGNRTGDFLLVGKVDGARRVSEPLGSRRLIDNRRSGLEGVWYTLQTIRRELKALEEI